MLHSIATDPDLTLEERVEVFIDLFANLTVRLAKKILLSCLLQVREETGRVARATCLRLAKLIGEKCELKEVPWCLALLRGKERDQVACTIVE